MAAISTKDFIQKAKKIHGDKYNYSLVDYKNSHTKVKIVCPTHGVFEQIPKSHTEGRGCKRCADLKSTTSKKDLLARFKNIHSNKYKYDLSNYKNKTSKIKIYCAKHKWFEQAVNNHSNGNGCPKCSVDKQKSNRKTFIKKAKKIHGEEYDYSNSNYINCKTKIEIICQKHGPFLQTPANHLLGKKCLKCSIEKRAQKRIFNKSLEFKTYANKVHNDKYDYSYSKYKKSTEKIKIICPKHGEFWQTPNVHSQGSGCPKCAFSKTEIEKYIESFLKNSSINFTKNDRQKIAPHELDFFIEDKVLAIECNGIYWHSELKGKGKNYHLNKTINCKKSKIQLIHIFENEIIHKNHIVKSRLKNILNLIKRKIYARKCNVVEISSKTKSKFLNKYHLQGSDKSFVKLGLFYKRKLVAVMTFRKSRTASGKKREEGEWELSRFATLSNFSIIGGAGKLLKYFEKKWEPNKVTSHADRRWSQGNLYEKLGFYKIRESKPNYWYFKGAERKLYHRYNFRKSKLSKKLETFDPSKTEWENMKTNGWNRIWDCGSLVFQKTY